MTKVHLLLVQNVTVTPDDASIRRIEGAAERLDIPGSQVVREVCRVHTRG